MEGEYKDFLAALGQRVKLLRKERGWSQKDMVVRHGYHDSQWRKYESGGGLTIPSLLRIANVFQLSLSKLLDGLAEFPQESLADIKGKASLKAAKGPKKGVLKK